MPLQLRKLRSLDLLAWRDLIRAQVALLAAQWRVRREPVGALAIRDTISPERVVGDAKRARQLALAIQRAATYGLFRPLCLVQSLALRALLTADGIEGASIRVGVRRQAGVFQAHAWVRWGGEILGDRTSYVEQFTEVDDLRVLGRQ